MGELKLYENRVSGKIDLTDGSSILRRQCPCFHPTVDLGSSQSLTSRSMQAPFFMESSNYVEVV
jgi:hypothetical protein